MSTTRLRPLLRLTTVRRAQPTTHVLSRRQPLRATPFSAATARLASTDSKSKDSTAAPQPKILSESPPDDADAPEDVKQHNREMAARADRPAEKVESQDVEKDKVGPGYWSGDVAGKKKDGTK